MAIKSKRAVLKTALLAPGGTLLAWAVQMFINGEPVTAGVAGVIGALLIGGFVAVQEYDLPYEDEVVSVIGDQVGDSASDEISDSLKDSSDDIADSLEEEYGSGSSDE